MHAAPEGPLLSTSQIPLTQDSMGAISSSSPSVQVSHASHRIRLNSIILETVSRVSVADAAMFSIKPQISVVGS